MIFALFPYKRRLRARRSRGALPAAAPAAARAHARREAARAAGRARVAAATGVTARGVRAAARAHPRCGRPRASVALLTGCVQDVFFHRVNDATVRVLAAEGCDVLAPRAQQCCGRWSCTPAARTTRSRAPGARSSSSVPGRRLRRHQRRRLRVVDEGLRPPARRRPRVGERAKAFSARGPRRARGARHARPRAPRHPSAPAWPTTTPAPRARASRCAASPVGAAHHPGASRSSTSRGAPLLRLGRHLQHRHAAPGVGAGRRKAANIRR
jgi:hypothetical protein